MTRIKLFATVGLSAALLGSVGWSLRDGAEIAPVVFHPLAEVERWAEDPPPWSRFEILEEFAKARGLSLQIVPPEAIAGEWPSSFFARVTDGSCSATLIGPRVLLTARHCFKGKDGKVPAEASVEVEAVKGTCRPEDGEHPDLAFCLMDKAILSAGTPHETVHRDSTTPDAGQEVRFTGFGVHADKNGVNGIGVLFEGGGRVKERPGEAGLAQFYYRIEALVSEGDSGGGVFFDAGQGRRLMGVISRRGGKEPCPVEGIHCVAALNSPPLSTALSKWVKDNGNPEVCGLEVQAGTVCR